MKKLCIVIIMLIAEMLVISTFAVPQISQISQTAKVVDLQSYNSDCYITALAAMDIDGNDDVDSETLPDIVAGYSNGSIQYYDASSGNTFPLQGTGWGSSINCMAVHYYSSTNISVLVGLGDGSVQFWNGNPLDNGSMSWTQLQDTGWDSEIKYMKAQFNQSGNPYVVVALGNSAIEFYDPNNGWTELNGTGKDSFDSSILCWAATYNMSNQPIIVVALSNNAIEYYDGSGWTALQPVAKAAEIPSATLKSSSMNVYWGNYSGIPNIVIGSTLDTGEYRSYQNGVTYYNATTGGDFTHLGNGTTQYITFWGMSTLWYQPESLTIPSSIEYSNGDSATIAGITSLNNGAAAQLILPNGPNGNGIYGYRLYMQNDGNLVEYALLNSAGTFGYPIWATGTASSEGNNSDPTGTTAQFSSDGVLMVQNNTGTIWSSTDHGQLNTAGGCTMNLQSDGNLVTYNSSNNAIWAESWDTAKLDLPSPLKVVCCADNGGSSSEIIYYDVNNNNNWTTIPNNYSAKPYAMTAVINPSNKQIELIVFDITGNIYWLQDGGNNVQTLFNGSTLGNSTEITAQVMNYVKSQNTTLSPYAPYIIVATSTFTQSSTSSSKTGMMIAGILEDIFSLFIPTLPIPGLGAVLAL